MNRTEALAALRTLDRTDALAVRLFRDRTGRTWRAALCDLWAGPRVDIYPALKRVRNAIGPSGLYALRPADLDTLSAPPAWRSDMVTAFPEAPVPFIRPL